MKSLVIASSALIMMALSACEPSTKPAGDRMTTDNDKRLNVASDSPSTARDYGVRAGATIPPATDRPYVYEPQTHQPTPTGGRDKPSDLPYLGNPTTRPVY